VRRALPWASIALLTLGVAAGAGLGASIPGSTSSRTSAARQLARILLATRAAGTAKITFSEISSSQNRDLRSAGYGQGLVNFATNSLRVSEQDRDTQFSGTNTTTRSATGDSRITTVWIGRTQYLQFDTSPGRSPWIRQSWPKKFFGAWGALEQFGPLGYLDLERSAPDLQLENLGPTLLRGIRTTAYLVVTPTCPSAKLTGVIASASAGPLELWVDGRGRLVQAQLSTRVDFPKQTVQADHLPGGNEAAGRATYVSTIELGDFGAQADVSPPPVHQLTGTGEEGFAAAKRANCG
jgi:hypothetical protein